VNGAEIFNLSRNPRRILQIAVCKRMGELESRDRWTGDERTRYYPVPLEGTVEGATGRATVAAREVATQELYLESGCSL
jgi:hypothetical protein